MKNKNFTRFVTGAFAVMLSVLLAMPAMNVAAEEDGTVHLPAGSVIEVNKKTWVYNMFMLTLGSFKVTKETDSITGVGECQQLGANGTCVIWPDKKHLGQPYVVTSVSKKWGKKLNGDFTPQVTLKEIPKNFGAGNKNIGRIYLNHELRTSGLPVTSDVLASCRTEFSLDKYIQPCLKIRKGAFKNCGNVDVIITGKNYKASYVSVEKGAFKGTTVTVYSVRGDDEKPVSQAVVRKIANKIKKAGAKKVVIKKEKVLI